MIAEMIAWITSISQGNEMIAGALTLSISGTIGFILRAMPGRIFNFLKTQLTTSMELNNTDWQKNATFCRLLVILQEQCTKTGSRMLMLDTYYDDVLEKFSLKLTMGYGNHFFIYRKKFIWMQRRTLDSGGSEKLKEKITLLVLGRSHDIFEKVLQDSKEILKTNKIDVCSFTDGGWSSDVEITPSPLSSLALNPETDQYFNDTIKYFLENEDDYRRLGIPYKHTLLLHGQPGNGKTSIIRGIASTFNMNICTINLSTMTDKVLQVALRKVPGNSIVVIEDFDSASGTIKRQNVSGDTVEEGDTNKYGEDSYQMLTLSGILNALDGIATLNKALIVLTTNCIESIDTAILRRGRVDSIIELPLLKPETVKNHLENLYPSLSLKEYPVLKGCELNEIKFDAKLDGDVAQQILLKKLEEQTNKEKV